AAARRATDTRSVAAEAASASRQARDRARAAAEAATRTATNLAGERSALIARFAHLQGISVELATRRQEAVAAAGPPEAPHSAPGEDSSEPDPPAASDGGTGAVGGAPSATPSPSPEPIRDPEPAPTSDPTGPPSPPPVDPPGSAPGVSPGSARAIAFARDQLGERYVWGGEGPDGWDCSGLTMAAWAAGGKSLPHYSVAQYGQATPIRASQLRPGDLLFWGSSGSPSSIYHVAIYVGGGRMIHAPRAGVPVSEVPVDYWIAPTFFARP
ncbi:MAG: C40 family peptidase, partial [Nocardioides sp.]